MRLEVTGLQAGYEGGWLLNLPSLKLPAGQHCLPAGAIGDRARRPWLHLLAGFMTPKQGRIAVEGSDLATMTEAGRDQFRAQHIGMVFQQLHLVRALSILENLLLAPYFAGLPADATIARQLLDELNIAETAERKPAQISQGQAQRAAIARAMMNKPLLLLADEPTSSLDDKHAEQVIQLLLSQARLAQASLVVATHDARIRPYFDGQPVIELGKPI